MSLGAHRNALRLHPASRDAGTLDVGDEGLVTLRLQRLHNLRALAGGPLVDGDDVCRGHVSIVQRVF